MNYESLNNNEHLTYEELVEYGQGNLSNSEMHRLEQHLIGCELCNEALEGISLLKQDEDPTVSVEKILKATGSQESTGLGLYYYIGIAASVLLIAVLGFVFLRTDNEPELLTEKTSQTHEEQLAESSSSKPEANPTQDTTQSASEETDYLATTEQQDVEATPTETQPVITQATPDTTTLIAVQPAAAQGEVSDFELSADISITPADSSLTLAEDSAILTLAEVATEEEQDAAKKARMAVPSQTAPAEEISELGAEVSGEYVPAEPSRGQRAYDRYLRRNLEYPEAARENAIEGDVVLNVTVNADGSLGEILVINSLGYGCDEEATRLVREGQNWQPATRGGTAIIDVVTVTVSFKL